MMKFSVIASTALISTWTTATANPTPLGSDSCTWGPAYYCSSFANALECKIEDVFSACESHCADSTENEIICKTLEEISFNGQPGSNSCRWGPSYYCSSFAHAIECEVKDPMSTCKLYCTDSSDGEVCQRIALNESLLNDGNEELGSNPCTWGPAYYCSSFEHATDCELENVLSACEQHCTNTAHDNEVCKTINDEKEPLGSNPCTWGPSFWCSSFKNAEKCDIKNPVQFCEDYCSSDEDSSLSDSPVCKTLNGENEPLGSNPCTWGPSFWCNSFENAARCDIENPVQFCEVYCSSEENNDLSDSPVCKS